MPQKIRRKRSYRNMVAQIVAHHDVTIDDVVKKLLQYLLAPSPHIRGKPAHQKILRQTLWRRLGFHVAQELGIGEWMVDVECCLCYQYQWPAANDGAGGSRLSRPFAGGSRCTRFGEVRAQTCKRSGFCPKRVRLHILKRSGFCP